MAATQVSNNEGTEKQNVRRTYNGLYFSFKEGGNSDLHYNMDEPRGHCAEYTSHKKANTV